MRRMNEQMRDLSSAFAREGYVTLPNVVSKSRLATLTEELRREYARARATGELVEPEILGVHLLVRHVLERP